MTSQARPQCLGTGQPVESYLAEVAAALPGPARAHTGIVAELRAGLLDAADAYRAAGMRPGEAEEAAVAEFGDPRHVARAFGAELAARQARRVALTLLATGPLVGLLWVTAAVASHVGIHHAPPWQWANMPPGSRLAFPLAGAVLAVTVWTALFTLATTGRLIRWLPARPSHPPAGAAIAGYGAAAADVIILVLLVVQLAHAPGILAPIPIAAATAASLTRLTLARRAARHCLAARAAVG